MSSTPIITPNTISISITNRHSHISHSVLRFTDSLLERLVTLKMVDGNAQWKMLQEIYLILVKPSVPSVCD